ncbi:MAG: PD40 domain-containing protein [Anaerolineales bacterium]|nr:PD40 domain-containing protein [Anaerolineales bacterium]
MRQSLTWFFSLILIVGLPGLALQLAPPAKIASLTSTPQPVPSPTVALPSTPAINYRYTGMQLTPLPQQVSFTYQGLAADVTGEIQLAKPYAGGPTGPSPDMAYPTHLRFYFYNDPASTPPTRVIWRPHLRIYPVEDYRSIYGPEPLQQATPIINETIDRLQAILVDRPLTFEGDIPFLPPVHDTQVFKAQVKYLDFSGGSGIRFITQHAIGGSISNQDIFYTFQGLTADGQYYIALFYPVSTPALASVVEGQSFETSEDFRRHVQESTQGLDALSPGDFSPNLSLLDGLIESLQITSPLDQTTSLLMDEPTAPTPTPVGGGTGKIAFLSAGNIYLMNMDGSNLTRLTEIGVIGCFAWSPDGQKIAFSSNYDIYVINAAGGDQPRLIVDVTPTHGDAAYVCPTWSADSQQLLLAVPFLYGIYVAHADGSSLSKLADIEGWDHAWSPDRQTLVFVSRRDREFEIYGMKTDGSSLTQLTDNTARDLDPAWSPDGQTIAFASDREVEDKYELYLMQADGSNPRKLTQTSSRRIFRPTWSPDGQTIVYTRSSEDGVWIDLIRADGTGYKQLVQGRDLQGRDPVWSPDGRYIAFRDDSDGISLMDTQSQNVTQLPIPPIMSGYSPAWQPSPPPTEESDQ